MPLRSFFTASLISTQQFEVGFYRHPCLVTEVTDDYVYFYTTTTKSKENTSNTDPSLLAGTSSGDAGPNMLRLAVGSGRMPETTRMNLEQRYITVARESDYCSHEIQIDLNDLHKLDNRITKLEARQNRQIYVPLGRDLEAVQPGTVLMLPSTSNDKGGKPVLVIENKSYALRYLPIKPFEKNIIFNRNGFRGAPRKLCLAMLKEPKRGHDGTPVLSTEPDYPTMDKPSYVEVQVWAPMTCKIIDLQTYYWPPVKISTSSMAELHEYMVDLKSQAFQRVTARPFYPIPPPSPKRSLGNGESLARGSLSQQQQQH